MNHQTYFPPQGGNAANKADKVAGAVAGDFAGLDASGNLTDSGHKHADYLTKFAAGQAGLDGHVTTYNITTGGLTISDFSPSDFLLSIATGSPGNFLESDGNGQAGLSAYGPSSFALRANNLSDLANVTTARTNLGLGSMALQNSSAVAITGGTIPAALLTGSHTLPVGTLPTDVALLDAAQTWTASQTLASAVYVRSNNTSASVFTYLENATLAVSLSGSVDFHNVNDPATQTIGFNTGEIKLRRTATKVLSVLDNANTPTFCTLRAQLVGDDVTSGTVPVARLTTFVASGASHARGIVPDPGSTAGTARYLREDATWATPPTGAADIWPLTGNTTDSSTTVELLGTGGARIQLPAEGVYGMELTFAIEDATNNGADLWYWNGVILYRGGSISFGSDGFNEVGSGGLVTGSVNIAGSTAIPTDIGGGQIAIYVTGTDSTTLNWKVTTNQIELLT